MRTFLVAILVGLMMCALPVEASADVDAEVTADSGAEPVQEVQEVQDPAPSAGVLPAAAAEPEPTPSTWSGLGWQLAGYVVPVLGSLLTVLVGFGIAWLKTKIADLKWRSVLAQLNDAVATAVAAVQQTVVDAMKKAAEDGKLTAEERDNALNLALYQIKIALGTKGLAALRSAVEAGQKNLDDYLRAKIEAAVANRKPVSP